MTSGPAPVYSSDPIAPRPADPPAIVADATDLKVLRKAVEDASTVGVGLWISYLFVLFYLLVAAGSVTHKDLFFETGVKLPFLSVDLPLKGFFALGPVLFLIVHAYVLLHFGMLSGKVRAFDRALRDQIGDTSRPDAPSIRAELRRQLPSNIFVQFLAGPGEIRNSSMGAMLWLIAIISLVIGPVCLLVFFELQFLPYHSEALTWWQRVAVGLDLVLMWMFWPRIALLDGVAEDLGSASQRMIRCQRRLTRLSMWGLSVGATLLLLLFATFPGEAIDEAVWQPKGVLPRGFGKSTAAEALPWRQEWSFKPAGIWVTHIPGAVRTLLVEGEVSPASRVPESLWSNRLVLPSLDIVVHLKLDSETKLDFLPETISLRNRNLDGAVLIGAVLRKADFTGAKLRDARLDGAKLQKAKFECADWFEQGRTPICAELQGAWLYGAQLQGASLDGAQLQGALLNYAKLQDASLDSAELQGASLFSAQLQGASLNYAQLQGASLNYAQLQGASLYNAQLQGASLNYAQLQGALLDDAQLQGALLDDAQLQGALLDGAELQGASLDDAQLQGASLDGAQLQGASLDDAQLQGASLKSVFIWRANAVNADATNAWIAPVPGYRSTPCNITATNMVCNWTKADFDDLIAGIKQSVPEGFARDAAMQRLDPRLNPDTDEPPDNEAAMQAWWNKPDSPRPPLAAYEAERAKHLQEAGCSAAGAPHVVARLARSLDPAKSDIYPRIRGLHDPFSANSPEPAKLAAAFLSDTCEGARGLSDSDKAILLKLRGPVAATPRSPPPAPAPK